MFRIETLYRKRLLNLALRFGSMSSRGVYIARGTRVYADLLIDQGTRINGAAMIKGHGVARIGKYCAIGDNLKLITSNHSVHHLALQEKLRHQLFGEFPEGDRRGVTIGHDVWIGDCVIILPGVEISHGAVIGAGAVVTRSVDAYAVVAGNPARPIGQRFEAEIVQMLLDLQWWNWSVEQFRQRRDLFNLDLSQLSLREFKQSIQAMMDCDA
jgi:acetyltransferase-like isoleucine patch superfamily enzyme